MRIYEMEFYKRTLDGALLVGKEDCRSMTEAKHFKKLLGADFYTRVKVRNDCTFVFYRVEHGEIVSHETKVFSGVRAAWAYAKEHDYTVVEKTEE